MKITVARQAECPAAMIYEHGSTPDSACHVMALPTVGSIRSTARSRGLRTTSGSAMRRGQGRCPDTQVFPPVHGRSG